MQSMNVHHLELFYHVARHGGIMAAVRNMPYGIQQPAVSGQLLQLEADLGVALFQRRPFQLTPAGRELFAFAEPFFGQLEEVEAKLRGEAAEWLRVAAPRLILLEHLPALLEQHRRDFPRLKLTLRDANQATAEKLLEKQEVDVAITEVEGALDARWPCQRLLELPLVLLVPAASAYRRAEQLWRTGVPGEPLITLPAGEALTKTFRAHAERIGCRWGTGIEVGSLDLVTAYAARGFGVGLSVRIPGQELPSGVRALPLRGCPPLVIAALWQKKLPPVGEAFVQLVKAHAGALAGRRPQPKTRTAG